MSPAILGCIKSLIAQGPLIYGLRVVIVGIHSCSLLPRSLASLSLWVLTVQGHLPSGYTDCANTSRGLLY